MHIVCILAFLYLYSTTKFLCESNVKLIESSYTDYTNVVKYTLLLISIASFSIFLALFFKLKPTIAENMLVKAFIEESKLEQVNQKYCKSISAIQIVYKPCN